MKEGSDTKSFKFNQILKSMKAYIAGPLFMKDSRKVLEKIDKICKELKIKTYLPHRDMGIYKKGDTIPFFRMNRDMIDECNFMIAYLDWKGISSGTAWEIGYAYAKKIPVIGLVEDIKTAKDYDRLCIMNFNSVDLVESLEELKKIIKKKFVLKK